MDGAGAIASLGGMPSPERVRDLEQSIVAAIASGQGDEIRLEPHSLTHAGLHARAVLIPAGTLLTGCETNLDNVCVVFGDIEVTTDDGPRRITGFGLVPALRGAKRVGFAHADTWWVTLHRTDLTDPGEILAEMTDEVPQSERAALPSPQRMGVLS